MEKNDAQQDQYKNRDPRTNQTNPDRQGQKQPERIRDDKINLDQGKQKQQKDQRQDDQR